MNKIFSVLVVCNLCILGSSNLLRSDTSLSGVLHKAIPVTFSRKAEIKICASIRSCTVNDEQGAELMGLVNTGRYRDNDEFKNFIHCAYRNAGYTYEDGTVNIVKSAPLYPDPVTMLNIMIQCDKKRGNTKVENTYVFFKCFQKNTPYYIGTKCYTHLN